MEYDYSMSAVLRGSSNGKKNSSINSFNFDIVCNENTQKKIVNRRSAVERLEETKANYVKTERVLDSKQNFEHSSNLHVSNTGSPLDVLLKGRIKSLYSGQNIITYVHSIDLTDNASSFTSEPKFSNNLVLKSSERVNNLDQREEHLKPIYHKQLQPDSSIYDQPQHKLRIRDRQHRSQTFNHGAIYSNTNGNSMAQNMGAGRYSFEEERKFRFLGHSEDKTEHSDIDQNSLGPSDESDDDLVELDDKKQSSRTSDYVSRSSSFKCSVSSDRVKNLVKCFESKVSNPVNLRTTEAKIKHVTRSKSDLNCPSEKFSSEAASKGADIELENFFNSLGNTISQTLAGPPGSPAHFFDSVSSLNSEDHLSNAGSEDSSTDAPREGLTNSDLLKHAPTDTSIVEKNARVVKWLYNCHNAFKKPAS